MEVEIENCIVVEVRVEVRVEEGGGPPEHPGGAPQGPLHLPPLLHQAKGLGLRPLLLLPRPTQLPEQHPNHLESSKIKEKFEQIIYKIFVLENMFQTNI